MSGPGSAEGAPTRETRQLSACLILAVLTKSQAISRWTNPRSAELPFRFGVFFLAALAIIAGHIHESSCPDCPIGDRGLVANGTFFTLLAVDLIPAVIFVVGIRRRKTLRLWGFLLLGLSTLPWTLGVLVQEVFLLLAYLGYPILLVGCTWGAIADQRASKFNR